MKKVLSAEQYRELLGWLTDYRILLEEEVAKDEDPYVDRDHLDDLNRFLVDIRRWIGPVPEAPEAEVAIAAYAYLDLLEWLDDYLEFVEHGRVEDRPQDSLALADPHLTAVIGLLRRARG